LLTSDWIGLVSASGWVDALTTSLKRCSIKPFSWWPVDSQLLGLTSWRSRMFSISSFKWSFCCLKVSFSVRSYQIMSHNQVGTRKQEYIRNTHRPYFVHRYLQFHVEAAELSLIANADVFKLSGHGENPYCVVGWG
jgi:hypothetical protein